MIYLQLFLTFVQIGFLCIGGGYVILPLIQNQIVETNQWITVKEFTDLITIAEMTPGPIAVNSATFVGIRVGGPLGAFVATIGCIFPSLFIVSVLSFVYHKYKNLSAMQTILGVLRAVVVVLIAIACLKIMLLMLFSGKEVSAGNMDLLALGMFAAALFVLRAFKINPIIVMISCGLLRVILSFVIK